MNNDGSAEKMKMAIPVWDSHFLVLFSACDAASGWQRRIVRLPRGLAQTVNNKRYGDKDCNAKQHK